MCGIAGIVNWGDSEVLNRMTDIQAHRGPDDRGTVWYAQSTGGTVGLGSRRLSILDLSPAGHMPMCSADGRLTIVYNGEVYNSPRLRVELEARGYKFRSHSDTEVVLNLYSEYGPGSLARLNGMFAFAIWDKSQNQLFLARDHFGVKPLYYIQQGNQLAFASEIKALFEVPGLPKQIDLRALHQYLTFLWVPDPMTMFKDILKLPAGHFAIFKEGRLSVTQYWDIRFPEEGHRFEMDEADLAGEVRRRFMSCVQAQMLSDVPIGAFLSAGLDSSSILAGMAQASRQPVNTYTIAFDKKYRRGEMSLDNTEVAARTAKHFGCSHTNIVVDPDVVGLLPELIWHMDEPVADPALIATYLVCKEARKNVTVLLSGVGGDEVFAGYRKHYAHYWAQMYRRLPENVRSGFLKPLVNRAPIPDWSKMRGLIKLAKKMVKSGSLPERESFLMNNTYFSEEQKKGLYSPDLAAKMDGSDAWRQHLSYFDTVGEADFLNQMLYLDTKAFMVSLNLTYNDKMSMASSVEVRVPFLDREFVEFVALNVPPELKLKGRMRPTTKYILREAMKGLLPPEVMRQRKTGFGAPIHHWLQGDLRPMVHDLLSETRLTQRGFFRPEAVAGLLNEYYSARQDWSYQIWALMTFELWLQKFFD